MYDYFVSVTGTLEKRRGRRYTREQHVQKLRLTVGCYIQADLLVQHTPTSQHIGSRIVGAIFLAAKPSRYLKITSYWDCLHMLWGSELVDNLPDSKIHKDHF